MDKIKALITTGSGLSLLATFVIAGLTAVQSHFTGNIGADVSLVIAVLGILTHPTTMVGGHSVPKR